MDLSGSNTTTADRTNYGLFVDVDSSADGDAADEHRIRGVGSFVNFTGFTDVAIGGIFSAESNYTSAKTAQLIGVQGNAVHDTNSTSGGVSNMYGVYGSSSPQDLGDVDNAYGGWFTSTVSTTRGASNVGNMTGVVGNVRIDKPDTITYGTITAVSGIIDNNETTFPTFGTQYLFRGDYQGTRGGNAYGIYCDGDKHYLEGNVGIGVTGPTEKLQVAGNVNILNDFKLKLGTTPTLEIYSDGSRSYIKETSVASGNFLNIQGTAGITLIGDGGTLFSGGSGNNTSMHDANGVSRFELTTSNAIFPSGNVGVNISNPAVPLSVEGKIRSNDSNSGDYLEIFCDGSASGDSYIENTNNNIQIKSAFATSFSTSGSVAMFIKNNQNVGIGDTNPSNKLDVNGDVRATQYKLRGNVTNPTTTAAAIYDQATVGLTLSAHNVELRNYNGSAMARSVFFTHNTATFTGTCTATNFILSSDKALKDNIREIDTKHIDVEWKNFELKSEPGVKRSGVIAQELEKKHPEFVRTDDEGLKSVAYIDLLISKIAELEARLEKAGI
jgi:hypothetical protein